MYIEKNHHMTLFLGCMTVSYFIQKDQNASQMKEIQKFRNITNSTLLKVIHIFR